MSFFSTLLGDVKVGLGKMFAGLSALGITPTLAHSMLLTFINAGLASAEAPLIHKLVAGYQEPQIVQTLIKAALAIPDLPPDVGVLLKDVPALAAAAAQNPTTGLAPFMAAVLDIETKLGL